MIFDSGNCRLVNADAPRRRTASQNGGRHDEDGRQLRAYIDIPALRWHIGEGDFNPGPLSVEYCRNASISPSLFFASSAIRPLP